MIGTKIPYNRKDKEEFLFPQEKIDICFHNNHVHFLYGDIDVDSVRKVIQWITYENTSSISEKTLTLYINSAGGDLYEAFGLIDTMKASKYTIRTIGIGKIMSAAFLIFISGTEGHRIIGENTGIMCHQYYDNFDGKHHDLKASMKEGEYCNERMMEIIKKNSSLDSKTIGAKLLNSSDVFLKSQEMLNLGLADQII